MFHTECVWRTAPAPRSRTTAKCTTVSSEGLPSPSRRRPSPSTAKNCSTVIWPLSTPLRLMARLKGSRWSTALKFPAVPKAQPRA